jgi:hypothetical protein
VTPYLLDLRGDILCIGASTGATEHHQLATHLVPINHPAIYDPWAHANHGYIQSNLWAAVI